MELGPKDVSLRAGCPDLARVDGRIGWSAKESPTLASLWNRSILGLVSVGLLAGSLVASAGAQTVRARDLGVPFDGSPGRLNAITDVAGVQVGHTTLIRGSGPKIVGEGPVRTGVTAVWPRGNATPDPVFAAWFALNGDGEMTGTTWVEDSGLLEGPVMITNTLNVGIVHHAVVRWGATRSADHEGGGYPPWLASLPVVAETWDGTLNDILGQHVTVDDALAAMDGAAAGVVPEGNVGGGTGMICHRFKGGIGTSSRIVEVGEAHYTVGVLVQCNYGSRRQLRVAGVPVGEEIPDLLPSRPGPDGDPLDAEDGADREGSIIVVVATDAPLLPHQLERVATRVSLGLGRNGSTSGNGSGDIFIAFSTANRSAARERDAVAALRLLANERLNPIFAATVQATEEAIVNAMVAAETMTGADDVTVHALPHDRLREILRRYNRLDSVESGIGTPEQRDALVDSIIEMSRRREAWSPPKEEALDYDPLAEMEAVRSDVVDAGSEEELFYALVKLSNARRDRHLSVEPVDAGLRVPERPPLRAPIEVRTDFSDLEAPGFFVFGVDREAVDGVSERGRDTTQARGSPGIRVGDRIVSVNGRAAAEYVETFTRWTRHSSVHGLLWHLGVNLPVRSPEVAPWLYRKTLDLELEREGERFAVSLPYLPPDEVDIAPGEAELYPGFSTVLERFDFHVLRPDDGRPVVILRWLDFEDELIQDVVDLMEYAQREEILDHTLIIDVTASSGGSRGAYAIQRLVSEPFRTTFGNIRISDAAEAMIERWATEPIDADAPDIFGLNESGSWLRDWARTDARAAIERGEAYTPATPFKLAHLPKDSDGILQPAPVHFTGRVAIIAGPQGGSHLDQFVSMFADNGLASVIGMPAGGYSNTWEAEEVLTMPGSDRPLALFMWNVGHTIRPNGEILEGNPVEPDVYVPLTRDNFRTYHRDLLEIALRRLRVISD